MSRPMAQSKSCSACSYSARLPVGHAPPRNSPGILGTKSYRLVEVSQRQDVVPFLSAGLTPVGDGPGILRLKLNGAVEVGHASPY